MDRDAAKMKLKNEEKRLAKRGRPPRIVATVETGAGVLTPESYRPWMREALARNIPQLLKRFIEDTSPRVEKHFRAVLELLEDEEVGTLEELMEEMRLGRGERL